MWLMDVIQDTMKEMVIEWTLHNVIVFTVITSSSILSVFGALRHIYIFAQKMRSARKRQSIPKSMLQKSKKKSSLSEQSLCQDKLMRRLRNCPSGKHSIIKDSMLYQKVLQKVKENIECLKTLQCDCEAPVRRCMHGLCRRCCERQGWCRRKSRENQAVVPNTGMPNVKRQQHYVQLSNQCLKEVPHRLGFHCMSATSINLSHNAISRLPEHMALIRQLRKINLSHNLLMDIPPFFATFRRLSVLDLQYNGLTVFPETLLALESVKNLYLDHNELCEVPHMIGYKLKNLTHFGLGFNQICKIPPSLFKARGLRLVRLCGNSTLSTLPFEVGEADYLEVLDVGSCSMRYLPSSIGHCFRLQHLILSNNRLFHLPFELAHCHRLVNLNISFNPLTYIPAKLEYFTGAKFFITALGTSFPPKPTTKWWILNDKIPSMRDQKNPPSLFHLARVCIKYHDLDPSPLPIPLIDKLTSYSNCTVCSSARGWSVRVTYYIKDRWETGIDYPFLSTVCARHLLVESSEDIPVYTNELPWWDLWMKFSNR